MRFFGKSHQILVDGSGVADTICFDSFRPGGISAERFAVWVCRPIGSPGVGVSDVGGGVFELCPVVPWRSPRL
jgi:hypothetical protein